MPTPGERITFLIITEHPRGYLVDCRVLTALQATTVAYGVARIIFGRHTSKASCTSGDRSYSPHPADFLIEPIELHSP